MNSYNTKCNVHHVMGESLQASSCSSANAAVAPVEYVLELQGAHHFEELH